MIIVHNGYAHRLQNNGLVQSAKCEDNDSGHIIDAMWKNYSAAEMSLTDGELATIAEELDSLSHRLPNAEFAALPHAEKPTNGTFKDPNAPR